MVSEDEKDQTVDECVATEALPDRESAGKEDPGLLKVLPSLQFYQKTYANSCGNNDAKALRLFKEYESRDKVQRLKQELFAISKGRASEQVCNKIIGLTRKGKYDGYDKWALSVLAILNSKG